MTARLRVYVTPKASRDEITGWRGEELTVRVSAAPDKGKANAAVCETVAKALGVPKSAVSVERGKKSRHKTLSVEGVTAIDLPFRKE